MDSIKSYESSDSGEDGEELSDRKCNEVNQAKVQSLWKPIITDQTSHPDDPCTAVSGVKGYGAFLHMQMPEVHSPPNASIYGITQKQKQTQPRYCYPHADRRTNSTLGRHENAHIPGQKSKTDYRQYPPPRNHVYSSMEGEGPNHLDIKTLSRKTSVGSEFQIQKHGQLSGHLEQSQHSAQRERGDTNLKRQNQNLGLKPYIPKRCRTAGDKRASDGKGAGEQSSKQNPDMFVTDPFIASQSEFEQTINRPPRHQFCRFDLHEGPVTRVQWNVPQFSHLLLSSSMDKTVRLWDYSTQRRCMQTLRCHEGAVKDAQWCSDGRMILSCGFDKTARLTDAQSGTNFQVFEHSSYVTCIRWHPTDPQLFISGTYGSTIYCWDTRTGEIAHQYSGKLGQILAVEFINSGSEFVASCDTVSRDSTDRTIMVWDTNTAALLSNQLYHEKYTCTSMKAHPTDSVFMAQSNADYIALFSTKRPYRLNKYQRFEGHQVEGYQIGCDFSPDGSLVASGSSDGKAYIYSYGTSALIKTLGGGVQEGGACMDVAWHPVMPSVIACCSWDGAVSVWT